MNIEDLTLREAKELAALFSESPKSNMLQKYVGKYVIVRSHNEGINAGYVKEIDETGVVLSEARRIWYHKPADKSAAWYEGVSLYGLSSDSKVSVAVDMKVIVEDYSLTLCSPTAEGSIKNFACHGQN
jgi:hypothetical protein